MNNNNTWILNKIVHGLKEIFFVDIQTFTTNKINDIDLYYIIII